MSDDVPTIAQLQHRAGFQRGSFFDLSTLLLTSTYLLTNVYCMNPSELKRHLAKQGCTFETHKGGSGHITVRRGNRVTQLPMHGSHKELGIKLINKILKDLGLK